MVITLDNFSNGYFWGLYTDLENQFQNFLGYVPYLEGNEKVYSFKLLNLMLSIGGHIDSAFLEMARYIEFEDNEKCKAILKKKEKFDKYNKHKKERKELKGKRPPAPGYWDYISCFEKQYGLSKLVLKFKRLPEMETLTPFKSSSSDKATIDWWDDYNSLKHNVSKNIWNANLKNARDFLACAFLLNVIHKPAVFRLNEYGLLKPKLGPKPFKRKDLEKILKNSKPCATVETTLFFYDYEKGQTYK